MTAQEKAKSIIENNFIQFDEEKPYWNFSADFIYSYYKVFELIGYESNEERELCKEQLKLLKSLITPGEYNVARIKGTAAAERIARNYSYGSNSLEFPKAI